VGAVGVGWGGGEVEGRSGAWVRIAGAKGLAPTLTLTLKRGVGSHAPLGLMQRMKWPSHLFRVATRPCMSSRNLNEIPG
jgi:hypothetical protein